MSKNKLLLILSLMLILLICSSLVYNDQQKLEALNPSKTNYNINNSSLKSTPASNKNIIKIDTSNLDYTYIDYKVKAGDDLYSLARNYMPNYMPSGVIKEIKEKNSLSNEKIIIDKTLLIPVEKNILTKK
ncbi:LysM domain-containing protein [Clostridium pasteurianum DSM 525 = ATCC 6013]|uniref:LysM domain-containing protein n=1 Tax=Clostridium pasteurianum DSM 525 = ATCC 6013 TaxID=1262449 RepID=A0A0H3J2P3_CLOPA|nr:LysM peptidoglycan-binding domain-containing protein [Clostridium pasteurianum]AJA46178.1 LysM domain-containing protein [Clostridium pasteurianum DSM 525 = ATCC 6013]AJA50166.1 LysM domain-containing protein [Clostridium pasteurianum DSM 525 = ATCC 6013]AOZ73638.1 protein containing LysM motif repeat [Clostridium pasteurianum DSM 525 = ATCC 6013]AOZ77435.1 protein containing LysM motif repeat [Clostridium pasteurianum]ELP57436.1 Protein containing LysM motif repeat [Clostridium pasteurianu